MLPDLGISPFLVISSDIYTDFDYSILKNYQPKAAAHLMMVPNPAHHPEGDFAVQDTTFLSVMGDARAKLTWASIGVFRPEFFANMESGKCSLRVLFDHAIANNEITGELMSDFWTDVGTPERYQALLDRPNL